MCRRYLLESFSNIPQKLKYLNYVMPSHYLWKKRDNMKKRLVKGDYLNVKVSEPEKRRFLETARRCNFLNLSDFTRQALREKCDRLEEGR